MKFIWGGGLNVGSSDFNLAARRFVSERLTIARELRLLSKADLAVRIGKTPSAISQFESGRLRPDGATLSELCLALDVPAGFFLIESRTSGMAVDQCHFRSLRSASQRDRRCLLARGSLLCELTSELEEIFDLPKEVLPRLDREISSDIDIEVTAGEIRRHWGLGLGPIPNVVWLLENKGVIVSYIPSDCQQVDAFSGWSRAREVTRPFVFLTSIKGAVCRSRFDACHELGHLVMHADAQPGNPELERQANHFASSFLLPRESFAREAPTWLNWDLIWELKRRWRVSARSILFRSHKLGLLSEASYRRGFIHLNQTCGNNEPFEPDWETPVVLTNAVRALLDDGELDGIASSIGLYPRQVMDLVAENGEHS
jgi:Zn-dependent peptidase ImmA (M78 family)/transcriptional regulator with XRE-family HTH domain